MKLNLTVKIDDNSFKIPGDYFLNTGPKFDIICPINSIPISDSLILAIYSANLERKNTGKSLKLAKLIKANVELRVIMSAYSAYSCDLNY